MGGRYPKVTVKVIRGSRSEVMLTRGQYIPPGNGTYAFSQSVGSLPKTWCTLSAVTFLPVSTPRLAGGHYRRAGSGLNK